MKKSALLALCAIASAATLAGSTYAAEGCGPGAHRGAYGHCRANPVGLTVTPHGLVVGTYYPSHGYWDGHRYWGHRYHYQGGWRYR